MNSSSAIARSTMCLPDFIAPSASSKNPKAFVANVIPVDVQKLVDALPVETFVEFFSAALQFELHLFFVDRKQRVKVDRLAFADFEQSEFVAEQQWRRQ